MVNFKIVNFCIGTLIRMVGDPPNELMVEYSVHLLESVGPFGGNESFGSYISHLKEKFEKKVSNRVRFMILGLVDLNEKKWIKKNAGPKTMEQVKADVMLEEQENQIQRDTYKQAATKHQGGKPLVIERTRPATCRSPTDSKKERTMAAVAASSASGTKIAPKGVSISKVCV